MEGVLSFWGSFFKVWFFPRAVLRGIIDRDTKYYVWPLILGYSLLSAFDPDLYLPLLGKEPLGLAFATMGLSMAVFMVGAFWFFIWFIHIFGRSMGGRGTFAEVAVAYAWCLPPVFVGNLLNLAGNAPTWARILAGETDRKALMAGPHPGWVTLCALSYGVLMVWSLVLDYFAVSEAHRLPLGKSLGVVLLSIVIALSMSFILGLVLFFVWNH